MIAILLQIDVIRKLVENIVCAAWVQLTLLPSHAISHENGHLAKRGNSAF